MISVHRERASVKEGGVVEIRCPDLQADTVVDVIILVPSAPKEKRYPASDFLTLLKDGPKISLKRNVITREWIHQKENDLYR